MKKETSLKTFAVAFSSDSGDHYYETFMATKEPNSDQILKAFSKYFGDEIDYLFVDHVWEVEPTITVKVKK